MNASHDVDANISGQDPRPILGPLASTPDTGASSSFKTIPIHGVLLLGLVLIMGPPQPCQATDYVVGPQATLHEIEDVPWESLAPGDRVLIHARPQPYRSKWVICRRGTPEQPIVVSGVPDAGGQLPVIDGREAVTRSALNFWSEGRGVIKIGGANRPVDTQPAHIVIENLDVRSARPPYQFKGREGITAYSDNAASIFIEKGEHITIRGCILHDSGNGLFTSPETRQILVDRCFIHGNGIEGSILEHNNYTSSQGIVFQFNQFGPLREGCLGNNVKDRSAGLVVRYNWIEGGNRMLDLVDGRWSEAPSPDVNYRETFVYGNILIKQDDAGNNQIVHYGGDSGKLDRYRMGTLHFFNNTVISHRPATTVLFRLSSMQEHVDCRNNLVWTTGPGRHLAIFDGNGTVDLFNNWFKTHWRESHSAGKGKIRVQGLIQTGEEPGWIDAARQDFRLSPDSPAVAAGGELPAAALPDHRLQFHYLPHRSGSPRPVESALDLGASPVVSGDSDPSKSR